MLLILPDALRKGVILKKQMVQIASPKEFTDFLIKSRKNAGLTQLQVANSLGYKTPQFVSNWERGKSYPPTKCIRELARLYRIETRSLLDIVQGYVIYGILEAKFRQMKRG
jgi:transcriptional regulator with XRE-family HTH domain